MSDIQKARDVLAKWGEAADKEAFEALLDADQDPEAGYWDYAKPNPGAHLIFGTAGNPDLLDAIDVMLGVAIIEAGKNMHFDHVAERIAAAILSADERMSA